MLLILNSISNNYWEKNSRKSYSNCFELTSKCTHEGIIVSFPCLSDLKNVHLSTPTQVFILGSQESTDEYEYLAHYPNSQGLPYAPTTN